MNTADNYKDLIEQYLDGELLGEELKRFELELQTNLALKQELEVYQLANQTIIRNKFIGLEETIQDVQKEYINKTTKRNQVKKGVLIGLVSVGFLVAGIYYLNQNSEIEPQKEIIPQKEKTADNKKIILNDFDTVENKTEVVTVEKSIQTPSSSVSKENSKIAKIDSISNPVIVKNQLKSNQIVDEFRWTADTNKVVIKPILEKDACEGVVIDFDVDISKPCRGEDNGIVELKNLKGGTAPYSLIIDGNITTDTKIRQVSKSTLVVAIRDVHGCIRTPKPIVVQEQLCKADLYLDPESGHPVVFPIYEKKGILTVFDKRGNSKFTASINENQSFEWFGNSDEGRLVAGYYLFAIKYEDGTVQQGSITITP